MPVSVTITISDADLPRVQAALTAAGIAQPKLALIGYIQSFVQGYEQRQAATAATAAYVPISPT